MPESTLIDLDGAAYDSLCRVKLKPQPLMMLSLALEALAVIREAEDVEDPLQRHADEPAELIRGVLIGVPPPASL